MLREGGELQNTKNNRKSNRGTCYVYFKIHVYVYTYIDNLNEVHLR